LATAGAARSSATHDRGAARQRFIDDFGQLLARYGVTLTLGRLFALLLISEDPLGLDELAAQLRVSKSGISVAARELERIGLIRRIGTCGSRRVLYEANEHLEPLFEATFTRIRQQLTGLKQAERLALRGRAKERLREMKDLHEFWLREGDGINARWRRRRESR
jgi:DNA-binding transcriptional regulator GbsR (MarR family)